MTNSSLPADPLNVNQVDFDDPVAMRAFHQAWCQGRTKVSHQGGEKGTTLGEGNEDKTHDMGAAVA